VNSEHGQMKITDRYCVWWCDVIWNCVFVRKAGYLLKHIDDIVDRVVEEDCLCTLRNNIWINERYNQKITLLILQTVTLPFVSDTILCLAAGIYFGTCLLCY
jgi:hypothetical protein